MRTSVNPAAEVQVPRNDSAGLNLLIIIAGTWTEIETCPGEMTDLVILVRDKGLLVHHREFRTDPGTPVNLLDRDAIPIPLRLDSDMKLFGHHSMTEEGNPLPTDVIALQNERGVPQGTLTTGDNPGITTTPEAINRSRSVVLGMIPLL